MKVPLRFQITENDSGITALINATSYVFERENVDKSLIKKIYKYLIDENNILKNQESICDFGKKIFDNKKYNLDTDILKREEVNLKTIKDYIKNKDYVMIVRVYVFDKIHYCLVTEIDNNYIYLFDSYYIDETYYDEERMVELVFDNPFKYNRKVNIKRFNSMSMSDYSLGPIEHREVLIIKK